MKPHFSVRLIIKQPLMQIPEPVFRKHRHLHEAIAHLRLKSYRGQYY